MWTDSSKEMRVHHSREGVDMTTAVASCSQFEQHSGHRKHTLGMWLVFKSHLQ